MSVLAERLREERERKGWTKVHVSRKLGIKTVSTYANWEYGLREPDADMLNKIADLYSVPVDYLTGRTNSREGNLDAINDLIEFLTTGKRTIYGEPMPQELIDDILGYARIHRAMDKKKDDPADS